MAVGLAMVDSRVPLSRGVVLGRQCENRCCFPLAAWLVSAPLVVHTCSTARDQPAGSWAASVAVDEEKVDFDRPDFAVSPFAFAPVSSAAF